MVDMADEAMPLRLVVQVTKQVFVPMEVIGCLWVDPYLRRAPVAYEKFKAASECELGPVRISEGSIGAHFLLSISATVLK